MRWGKQCLEMCQSGKKVTICPILFLPFPHSVFYGSSTVILEVRWDKIMTLTLLLVGGLAIALTSAYVVSTRTYETAAEPILAGGPLGADVLGQATAVGLADPAVDTMTGPRNGGGLTCDWQLTTLSALGDAEELLDYLEVHGYEERELVVLGNSCFAVRWR